MEMRSAVTKTCVVAILMLLSGDTVDARALAARAGVDQRDALTILRDLARHNFAQQVPSRSVDGVPRFQRGSSLRY